MILNTGLPVNYTKNKIKFAVYISPSVIEIKVLNNNTQ